MEIFRGNKDKSQINFDMKSKDLGEMLSISTKDCVVQSVDFLRNSIFDGGKFFIFGSGMEVLLGNSNLAMHDIDIQVVINGEEDKQKIIQNFKDNGFKCMEGYNPGKKVFIRGNMCFDVHFLEERGGYFVEHSSQGDFEYPIEGYGYTSDDIGYMKPALCLQIVEGGRWSDTRTFKGRVKYKFGKRGRKNERRVERLKKLLDKDDNIPQMRFVPKK